MLDTSNEYALARAALLINAAQPIMADAKSDIEHCQLFDDVKYAITYRMKSPTRMVEKVAQRHGEGRADYSLEKITDIIGVRFITLYREDIAEVVRSILKLVTNQAGVQSNRLAKATVAQMKVYYSNLNPDTDPLVAELSQIFHNAFEDNLPCEFEREPRSRYSSVHMVLEFDNDSVYGRISTSAELQIRSVFEDAWGQIDHKLFLEQERRGGEVNKSQREIIAQHMGVLKRMLDTAAEYADVVRRTLVVPASTPTLITRSVGGPYVSTLSRAAKLPLALASKIEAILAEKARVDEEIEEGIELTGPNAYVRVADQLGEIIQRELDRIDPVRELEVKRAREALRGSLLLEEALCRLLSEDRQQIRLSIAQYEVATKSYPDNPIGWLRYGQAMARMSFEAPGASPGAEEAAQAAADAYDRASESLVEFEQRPKAERDLLLAQDARQFLHDNIDKLQGFLLWRNSDRRRKSSGPTERDFREVVRAYGISYSGVTGNVSKETSMMLCNNALYYAIDAHDIAETLGDTVTEARPPEKERIEELLGWLESSLPANCSDVKSLDTIMRAKVVLGDGPGALVSATQILDINTDGSLDGPELLTAYYREMIDRAVRRAWSIRRAAT